MKILQKKAIEKLGGQEVSGRVLKVKEATQKSENFRNQPKNEENNE